MQKYELTSRRTSDGTNLEVRLEEMAARHREDPSYRLGETVDELHKTYELTIQRQAYKNSRNPGGGPPNPMGGPKPGAGPPRC